MAAINPVPYIAVTGSIWLLRTEQHLKKSSVNTEPLQSHLKDILSF